MSGLTASSYFLFQSSVSGFVYGLYRYQRRIQLGHLVCLVLSWYSKAFVSLVVF